MFILDVALVKEEDRKEYGERIREIARKEMKYWLTLGK